MKTKFAGSGSTWVRYLIECASGVFTGCIINCLHSNLFLHLEYKGSVYKDLELQLKGYWGEIRDWRDGTTIVQKTHDSGPELIRLVFLISISFTISCIKNVAIIQELTLFYEECTCTYIEIPIFIIHTE